MYLETIYGPWAVAAIFVVAAVGGGSVAAALSPDVPSIGASGADFGFAAALIMFLVRFPDFVPRRMNAPVGAVFLVFVATTLLRGLTSEHVDNACHFGGFAMGLAFAAFLRPVATEAGRRRNRGASIGAMGLAAGWIALAGLSGPGFLPMVDWDTDGLRSVRPTWWRPGWTGNSDVGWTSPVSGVAVSMTTSRSSDPLRPEAGLDRWIEGWRAVDPDVRVLTRDPVTRDDLAGWRVELRWKRREGERWTVAEVYPRGRYVQSVAVDVPLLAGQERPGWMDRRTADRLEAEVFGSLAVGTPKAVEEAVSGLTPDTTRSRLALAKGASDLGDWPTARALYDEAVAKDPQSTRALEARLDELAAWRDPETKSAADEVVARFPDDRRLRVRAAEALVKVGDPAGARRVLEDGLRAAPADRQLDRALRKLGEGGSPPP
jgi:hypothetical protein